MGVHGNTEPLAAGVATDPTYWGGFQPTGTGVDEGHWTCKLYKPTSEWFWEGRVILLVSWD